MYVCMFLCMCVCVCNCAICYMRTTLKTMIHETLIKTYTKASFQGMCRQTDQNLHKGLFSGNVSTNWSKPTQRPLFRECVDKHPSTCSWAKPHIHMMVAGGCRRATFQLSRVQGAVAVHVIYQGHAQNRVRQSLRRSLSITGTCITSKTPRRSEGRSSRDAAFYC